MALDMRLWGLPNPHPDELLCSLIARSAVALAEFSPKGLNAQIFKNRGVVVSPDLQSSLGLLSAIAQDVWGIEIEQVIDDHTLANYYCHYLEEKAALDVRRSLSAKNANVHVRLGICASSVEVPRFFQMCRKCVASDLSQYGYTFFRRSQHLPGVLVCKLHATALTITREPFRPRTRHQHVLPHHTMLEEAVEIDVDERHLSALIDLAKASESILNTVPVAGVGLSDYRLMLKEKFPGSHITTYSLASEKLRSIYGEKNLALIFKGNRQSEFLWLKEVLRTPRRALHPIKHLMLKNLLEETDVPSHLSEIQSAVPVVASNTKSKKSWGIYLNPDLRNRALALQSQGLSERAIGRELSVDSKTVKKLLAPPSLNLSKLNEREASIERDKSSWLAILDKNPTLGTKQLRKHSPALYARLYRSSKDWLLSSTSDRKVKTYPREARVDWHSRDLGLASKIEGMAIKVKATRPFIRASKSFVLGQLNCRPLFAHFSGNLPLACAALNSHCESVYQFHVRRLSAVLAARQMTLSRAFREARINQYRYPDGGVSLFKEVCNALAA